MTLPLCVRIDASDTRSADNLKADGWREIEILETYLWKKVRLFGGDSHDVSSAKPDDVDVCAKIAVKAFKHDRLHKDSFIPKEVADEAKDNWVRVAFTDRKKKIFVARSVTGEVIGFIIVGKTKGEAYVDLLAADPDYSGVGVGGRLLRHAMIAMDSDMRAGTQADNKEASVLYKRNGFEIVKRQRTFHK